MVHNDPIIEDIFIILTQYDFYCMIIWIDFFFVVPEIGRI